MEVIGLGAKIGSALGPIGSAVGGLLGGFLCIFICQNGNFLYSKSYKKSIIFEISKIKIDERDTFFRECW